MRIGVMVFLAALVGVLSACGSTEPKVAAPPQVTQFTLQSKLLGREMYEEMVTPAGGGKGRPLLVFLHGYGGTPNDTATPALLAALRRLGDRAPVVLLPEGQTGSYAIVGALTLYLDFINLFLFLLRFLGNRRD